MYSRCKFTAVWLGEFSRYNAEEVLLLDQPDTVLSESSHTSLLDPMFVVGRLIESLDQDQHLTSIKPFDCDETDPHFIEIRCWKSAFHI